MIDLVEVMLNELAKGLTLSYKGNLNYIFNGSLSIPSNVCETTYVNIMKDTLKDIASYPSYCALVRSTNLSFDQYQQALIVVRIHIQSIIAQCS